MTKTANATCILQLIGKNQKPSDNKFEVTMMEAIDESLSSFASLDKLEVYRHLENCFKIRKQEIPFKTEEFADAMGQMFGIGAKLVEIKIIETVHKRVPEFKFTPRRGTVVFKEYIANLRAFLLKSS